jgi:hypothetical protein
MEESKTEQLAIKRIRLSKKVVETKHGLLIGFSFGGPETMMFPNSFRQA